MPCSAVTLSLATITGIIATALLAIAFSTDNWLYTEVKRAQIQEPFQAIGIPRRAHFSLAQRVLNLVLNFYAQTNTELT
ncbi:hypothetical protein KQX54_001953 [Cotesia glomerata]|uniref:Uncharacterized protein n=1 Tax=Cotesia glomerata TaxID=32391 RepID=A0AAV7IWL7_COTGL|nr:hypothetical protein KQX54_001953 [Cotesia glomerata]